jgi:hypothetical protein
MWNSNHCISAFQFSLFSISLETTSRLQVIIGILLH